MKSAGKARNNGLYRHIRTSKEIIRNLLNDYANIRNICIAISSRNLSVIAFCVCAWRTYSELRKGGLE